MDPNLKMLWHGNYYDGCAINGLAEYNGERVYFTEKDGFLEIDPNNYPKEVADLVTALQTKISVGNYEIELDVTVTRKLSYDIYRLPPDTLLEYEAMIEDFSQQVGYHTWHDPAIYKPFIAKDGWQNHYRNPRAPIQNFDVAHFTHLGTFTYDKFQYFDRPMF